MKLFGLDIVRCSKLDQQELNTYKKIVQELNDRLIQYLDFLSTLMNYQTGDYDDEEENNDEEQILNEEACVQLLFEHTETVCKLIIMYDQNKFSLPITDVSMLQRMNHMREHAGLIQTAMIQHQTMLQQRQVDESEYSDSVESQYDQVEERYQASILHMERILFADINKMISVIQYDLFRIIFGVDIIRSHYKIKKRPPNKPDFEVKVYNRFYQNKSNGGN